MEKYIELLAIIQLNISGNRKRRIKRIRKSKNPLTGLQNLPVVYYFYDLEVLLTALNYGLVGENIDVCYYAANTGNLEIMKYARAKGMDRIRGKPYPWDSLVYNLAKISNNKELIDFIETPLFYGKCPTDLQLDYYSNPKRIDDKNIKYIEEIPVQLSACNNYSQTNTEDDNYFDKYSRCDNFRRVCRRLRRKYKIVVYIEYLTYELFKNTIPKNISYIKLKNIVNPRKNNHKFSRKPYRL